MTLLRKLDIRFVPHVISDCESDVISCHFSEYGKYGLLASLHFMEFQAK